MVERKVMALSWAGGKVQVRCEEQLILRKRGEAVAQLPREWWGHLSLEVSQSCGDVALRDVDGEGEWGWTG